MTDGDTLGEMFDETERETRLATDYYAMLRNAGNVSKKRVVVYRCVHRCTLAEVFLTPPGVIVHQPRYKLSPEANAASSSSDGRRVNTEDGDRRWRERTFFLSPVGDLDLNCDHLRHALLSPARVNEDARRRVGDVTIGSGVV